MKTIDALNILSIAALEITQDQVKSAYRKACKIYHPDINPAGLAMMQAVNEAYEKLMNERFPILVAESEITSNYGEILNAALNAIIGCVGLSIEICGAWIWVSGGTKANKDILKSSGFMWSNQKKMWYFRPQSQKKRFYRGQSSIEEIRVKYGSEKINSKYRRALS
jgi:hypothetical protein